MKSLSCAACGGVFLFLGKAELYNPEKVNIKPSTQSLIKNNFNFIWQGRDTVFRFVLLCCLITQKYQNGLIKMNIY